LIRFLRVFVPVMEFEAPAHRAGLPGKEAFCFFIAPLIPACKAGLAGCAPGHIKKGHGLCAHGFDFLTVML
jgi:hypothetical protein